MKTKFISLLVSILYLPLIFIGQFIGNIIGSLLTPIIKTFDLLWISWIINFISDIECNNKIKNVLKKIKNKYDKYYDIEVKNRIKIQDIPLAKPKISEASYLGVTEEIESSCILASIYFGIILNHTQYKMLGTIKAFKN